jgi:hypothetical protein
MCDPWAFGWAQLLTIIGFFITIVIAVCGFRTFGRWKREKLEERRIEIAFEAWSIAYKSKIVFDYIRQPLVSDYEWEDMPASLGETENKRNRLGSYYTILKRIENKKEFFDCVVELQPKCMAVFDETVEDIFLELWKARTLIVSAAQMMLTTFRDEPLIPNEDNAKLKLELRADLWGWGDSEEGEIESGENYRASGSRLKLCVGRW